VNLARRQACARREIQHELIVRDGAIDGQLRHCKLDGVLLVLVARSEYFVGKESPSELPMFVAVSVGDDGPVLVIKELPMWPQISSARTQPCAIDTTRDRSAS
jgi:hypothetical protein